MYQTIKRSFPNDVVLHNLYFETGNYIEPLKIYESLQIDFIMICSEGVFCVDAKAIIDDNYSLLGGATAKKWTIKTSHGTNTETNGVKQNHKHAAFLEQVLEFEKIKCPVYKITVIGIIQRSKIKVQEYIDDNLVSEGELIDRIEYIKKRNKSVKIDVDEIKNILEDWKCEIEGIDKLHMVYVRNIKNKKLPKRCKKVLRQL